MPRFECSTVLFDLDGVLVDSAAYVEREWRRWANGKGLPPEPFLRVCHGRRAVETIRLAAPELDAEAEARAFRPADDGAEAIGPLPGAAGLLAALPAASWAVVTSGVRATAAGRLRHAGLPVPAVMVCAEDVARGKPSPAGYLRAARELGAVPADCLVVEDAPAGLEAARAAGMRVVALATTHPLEQLTADAIAPSLLGVHLGRVDRSNHGRHLLELIVAAS